MHRRAGEGRASRAPLRPLNGLGAASRERKQSPGHSSNSSSINGSGSGIRTGVASSSRAGTATLAELCTSDKKRVARLVAELAKAQEDREKDRKQSEADKHALEARLDKLREQNAQIIAEMVSLRGKYTQAIGALKACQTQLRAASEAAQNHEMALVKSRELEEQVHELQQRLQQSAAAAAEAAAPGAASAVHAGANTVAQSPIQEATEAGGSEDAAECAAEDVADKPRRVFGSSDDDALADALAQAMADGAGDQIVLEVPGTPQTPVRSPAAPTSPQFVTPGEEVPMSVAPVRPDCLATRVQHLFDAARDAEFTGNPLKTPTESCVDVDEDAVPVSRQRPDAVEVGTETEVVVEQQDQPVSVLTPQVLAKLLAQAVQLLQLPAGGEDETPAQRREQEAKLIETAFQTAQQDPTVARSVTSSSSDVSASSCSSTTNAGSDPTSPLVMDELRRILAIQGNRQVSTSVAGVVPVLSPPAPARPPPLAAPPAGLHRSAFAPLTPVTPARRYLDASTSADTLVGAEYDNSVPTAQEQLQRPGDAAAAPGGATSLPTAPPPPHPYPQAPASIPVVLTPAGLGPRGMASPAAALRGYTQPSLLDLVADLDSSLGQ